MRKLILLLALLLAITGLSITPTATCDDLNGNESCEACLADALQMKIACEAAWDYGKGDPDCDDKYDRAVSDCQRVMCIY
jgi:hypothetical protein